MTYEAPAPPSSGVNLDDLNGRLLLIDVLDQKHDVPTNYGPKNPVSANIAILDGPDKGTQHENVLLFPMVLIDQLKVKVGRTVLARLVQGNAKPGQKPPWLLAGATDDDVKIATKYEAWKLQQAATAAQDDEEPF